MLLPHPDARVPPYPDAKIWPPHFPPPVPQPPTEFDDATPSANKRNENKHTHAAESLGGRGGKLVVISYHSQPDECFRFLSQPFRFLKILSGSFTETAAGRHWRPAWREEVTPSPLSLTLRRRYMYIPILPWTPLRNTHCQPGPTFLFLFALFFRRYVCILFVSVPSSLPPVPRFCHDCSISLIFIFATACRQKGNVGCNLPPPPSLSPSALPGGRGFHGQRTLQNQRWRRPLACLLAFTLNTDFHIRREPVS